MSCSLTSHATGSVDIVLALLLLDTAVVAGVDTEEAAAGNELDDAEDADAALPAVRLTRLRGEDGCTTALRGERAGAASRGDAACQGCAPGSSGGTAPIRVVPCMLDWTPAKSNLGTACVVRLMPLSNSCLLLLLRAPLFEDS